MLFIKLTSGCKYCYLIAEGEEGAVVELKPLLIEYERMNHDFDMVHSLIQLVQFVFNGLHGSRVII